MGHDGVASGYPTPTDFLRLTGCQRDPRDRGVTTWYQSLGIRIPRTRWARGYIMHCHVLRVLCLTC